MQKKDDAFCLAKTEKMEKMKRQCSLLSKDAIQKKDTK